MPELRKYFESLTEDLFHFNLLLIPFGYLMGATYGRLLEPLSLLLFLPILPYFYFLRQKIKKLSLFLFVTWATCAIGLFTPHKFFYTIFIALLCIHSVRRRTNAEAKLIITFELLCFPLVFLTVLYGASDYLHVGHMQGFIYGQAIAIFIISLLYVHLRGINAELELASASSLQSTKVITGFANKFLSVYVVGFLIVLGLFRFMPFGNILILLGRMIRTVLRFLFSFITGDQVDQAELPPPASAEEMAIGIPADDPSLLVQIIEKILIYVINILFLLAIIAFIVWFFLKLYRGFYSKRKRNLYYRDESSQVTALKRTPRRRLSSVKIDNAVRRRYFKRINKYFKRSKLSKADTPAEIELKLKDKENLTELTVLYEQARYSRQ